MPTLPPSPWITRFAPLVRAGGAVLDLACGGGRHTLLFLDRGHPVTALDRDPGQAPAAAERIAADLEDGSPWPLPGRRFAALVVTNYLWRPLFPHLLAALEEGGVLLYETFARGNEAFGRPRNPDHLLERGELLRLTAGLTVVAFEDGILDDRAVVQRLCAVRGEAVRRL
ncbi:bifunctional 2-polyprenyl-6-hydroxyphenol methylase/3-demethylubiquinol 3-O-methyltransferase UbiG [Magnetospirillum sp. UT-4]|uniref:class I SAM-dependent methyltransferase n=1 Tax=Magnetospirillum sp. UT-4 TaxID=2681467 RepID=UPI001C2DB36D|nr:class I SAM-dependent methyltransferase [Magnetospirillum sp. UT-4]